MNIIQQDLLKRDEALVKNFDFPPKKSVGNKAGKVVEDRRKRLQGKPDILISTYCHFPDLTHISRVENNCVQFLFSVPEKDCQSDGSD